MDRLITELKMSPGEAYTHLSQLLEQVNAVMGSFFQGERMEEDLKWRERLEERRAAASARAHERAEQAANSEDVASALGSTEYEEKDDEDIYFAPEKNNVIFSSAVDGWAFTVKQFAGLYEKKLGIKRSVLEKVLWGDFYLDPKTKRVLGSKHLKGRNLKPMFVQLVLENVWAVYNATTGGNNGKGCVDALLSLVYASIYTIFLLIHFFAETRLWWKRLPKDFPLRCHLTFFAPEIPGPSSRRFSLPGSRCLPPCSCPS
jgi:ribosome assembly protein 1